MKPCIPKVPACCLLLFLPGSLATARGTFTVQAPRNPQNNTTTQPVPPARLFVQTDWSGNGQNPGVETAWGADFSSGGLSAVALPGQLALPSQLLANPTKEVFTMASHSTKGMTDGDVDQDGCVDLISCRPVSGPFPSTGNLHWWKRPGPGAWLRQEISNNFYGAYDVRSGDIDGDGDLDIVACAFYGTPSENGRFAWFENLDGFGLSWSQHLIGGFLWGAENLEVADLDGDGDLDVIGVASLANIGNLNDDVVWFENLTGDGTGWTQHTIDSQYSGATGVEIADIDGDGDPDVVGSTYASDDVIVWWENQDGAGNLASRKPLESFFPQMAYIHAVDLDRNGTVDLIGGSPPFPSLFHWDNTTGGAAPFPVQPIGPSSSLSWDSMEAGDVDGDGDLDIVGSASFGTQEFSIWWFENDGTTTTATWPVHFLENGTAGYDTRVHLADYNGDGKIEIVAAASNTEDDQLSIWEIASFKQAARLVSTVLDGGAGIQWERLEWDAIVPPGTSLSVDVRSGATRDGLGAFVPVPNSGASLAGLIPVGDRFVQYRVRMSTTVPTSSPIFQELRLHGQ